MLIEFGTPEQKSRFLPGIISGTVYWCQGYSEPGAGSDLASLKTRAEFVGGDYVVNGQKTWTTGAHEADMMYALVRTSREARKQDGITMLLIPMDTSGVQIRPIRTIDGRHHVNEVFFDDVRVPAANRIGEEGKGWGYGKFLLSHERLGGANVAPLLRQLVRIRGLVADEYRNAPDSARRLDLEKRLLRAEGGILGVRELGRQAIEYIVLKRPLGTMSSVIKLLSSGLMQELDEIALDATGGRLAARYVVIGFNGVNDPEAGTEWLHNFLHGRARTIYGGSSEVQKNVLARALFGA